MNIHNYYRILREKSRHLLKKLGDLGEKLIYFIKKPRYFAEKLRYLVKRLRYRTEKMKYLVKKLRYLAEKLIYHLAEKLKPLTMRINGRKLVDIFLGFAAVAVIVLITTNRACETPDEPRRTARHIDITISPQGRNFFGDETLDALIREFEDQNPGLRIQSAAPDGQDSGTGGADIVFFDDSGFGSLANNAYLHVETLVSFMDLFFYNIDILKTVKLDRPPKTRAEFLAAARAVAKKEADSPGQEPVYPFALGLHPSDPMALRRDFYPWVWASGGGIPPLGIADENTTLPRAHTDIIAFFEQLNREELLAPEAFEKTGTHRLEEFAAGKIAMMTAGARDIPFVLNNADGITFGITTIPLASQGKTRIGLLHIYAGINSACALPDEARIFLSFIAGKSQVLASALGAVPGSFPGAFPGDYIAEDALYSKAWDIFESADIVEYKPSHLFEAEIDNIIREKLAEALK